MICYKNLQSDRLYFEQHGAFGVGTFVTGGPKRVVFVSISRRNDTFWTTVQLRVFLVKSTLLVLYCTVLEMGRNKGASASQPKVWLFLRVWKANIPHMKEGNQGYLLI